MCVTINRGTQGFDNNGTNLFDRAIELARDGNLSTQDTQELQRIAESDGNYTGLERAFVDGLKSEVTGNSFAELTSQSDFNPNGFEFQMTAETTVRSAGGHDIKLQFSDNPSSAKQIHGDITSANQTLESLIPSNRLNEWNNLDKHNISAVNRFLDSLNLSTPQKAQFVQAYMTANFEHTGQNIEWGGASLQEGINAVPTDANGRKYLDCEGYIEVARSLMGSEGFTPLTLASGDTQVDVFREIDGEETFTSVAKRDHQVAVFREGNDAYVISNNEITRIEGGASRGNEALVQQVYPEFSRITEDPNGAMRTDTTAFEVGQSIPLEGGSVDIDSITDGTHMTGVFNSDDGHSVHVNLEVLPDGRVTSNRNPQEGDTFNMGAYEVTVGAHNTASVTGTDGTHFNARVNGNNVIPVPQAGDVFMVSGPQGNVRVTMDNASTGTAHFMNGSRADVPNVPIQIDPSNGNFSF